MSITLSSFLAKKPVEKKKKKAITQLRLSDSTLVDTDPKTAKARLDKLKKFLDHLCLHFERHERETALADYTVLEKGTGCFFTPTAVVQVCAPKYTSSRHYVGLSSAREVAVVVLVPFDPSVDSDDDYVYDLHEGVCTVAAERKCPLIIVTDGVHFKLYSFEQPIYHHMLAIDPITPMSKHSTRHNWPYEPPEGITMRYRHKGVYTDIKPYSINLEYDTKHPHLADGAIYHTDTLLRKAWGVTNSLIRANKKRRTQNDFMEYARAKGEVPRFL